MVALGALAALIVLACSEGWSDPVSGAVSGAAEGAAGAQVQGIRIWPAPEHTRLVLDLSGPVRFSYFHLPDPERLVLDLQVATLRVRLPTVAAQDLFLARLRSARRSPRTLRIVLDLKRDARSRVFALSPNARYGHRLVVDLHVPEAAAAVPPPAERTRVRPRDVLVAVDAGHGGEDPGAIGPDGIREKDLTLEIARNLVRRLEAERGMRAFLVRRGDYYLSLKKRRELARARQADMFISLHADAFLDKRVRGGSVYVLSDKGASSETAHLLARRENASDLIAGVKREAGDELLYKVLLDLSLTATREASYEAAEKVLGEFAKAGRLHKFRVQWANFMVLRSPNIPSILCEVGFISNPGEARKLRDPRYQEQLVTALFKGVKSYFRQRPPAGTLLAQGRADPAAP